jgi:hypothetical protein
MSSLENRGWACDTAAMSQLELKIERQKENDRNLHLGGRSFYFFDFDDNVAFLTTPILLFHKLTGEEIKITSAQWAQEHFRVGKEGLFAEYNVDFNDQTGSFKHFRDHDPEGLVRLGAEKQIFVQDIAAALGFPEFQWKGPSWSCFFHAAFNQRPVSVITARGHHPTTIKEGIKNFVEKGHLPIEPNYLSIFPVSHKETRRQLGDHDLVLTTAELKQRAIRESVMRAIEVYGYSPHHRFGMSDDDPKNIQLVIDEMQRLKSEFPEMKFFMIETQNGEFVKHEVQSDGGGRLASEILQHRIEQVPLF